MAERVVPVLTPPSVQSRPERQRGRHARRFRWLITALVGLVVFAAASVITAHFLVIDHGARTIRATGLIPAGSPARALVVVAHPGDELQVAGTVAELTSSGVAVTLLALTQGEAQSPTAQNLPAENGAAQSGAAQSGAAQSGAAERGAAQEAGASAAAISANRGRLADIRRDEFARAAEVLGVRRAVVAGLADGSLMSGDPSDPASQIAAAAAKARASVIIAVGAVGTTDSDAEAVIALATRAAQTVDSTVARVWEVTRGARETQWINRVAGPVINTAGLAEADVAVRIERSGGAKSAVLLSHATQRPVIGRDFPWAELIPAQLYFRFLDREYFHLAWGQQMH